MKRGNTYRGFALVDFEDRNGKRCSLQKSSIADESCIWLGIDKPDVDEVGWHPVYPLRARPFALPEGVTAWGRMHLTQDQVRELLPLLQHFAEHGELP